MGAYSSTKSGSLDYKQIVTETSADVSTATDTSRRSQESKNVRDLVSQQQTNLSKNDNSTRIEDSEDSAKRSVVSFSNRAFQVSFTIPIKGPFPKPPIGTSNC